MASVTLIRGNVFQLVNVKIIKAYLARTSTTYFGVHSHVTPESIDTYFSVTTSSVPLPLETGGDQESILLKPEMVALHPQHYIRYTNKVFHGN